jgi:DNA-binding SARP family transcriptional activator
MRTQNSKLEVPHRTTVSRRDTHGVSVRLLDRFEITVESRPVRLPDASQRLLAFLALSPARGRPRLSVAGALWPDRDESRAMANLRSARWRISSLTGRDIVDVRGDALGLDGVQVDALDIERDGWNLVGDGTLTDSLQSKTLFADLLPGWYDDWVIVERERRGQMHLRFADALVEAHLRGGNTLGALDVALRSIAIDPLREAAQALLARVYCAEGNLACAQQQLDRYRKQLASETGLKSHLTLDSVLAASTRS